MSEDRGSCVGKAAAADREEVRRVGVAGRVFQFGDVEEAVTGNGRFEGVGPRQGCGGSVREVVREPSGDEAVDRGEAG